MTTPAEPADPQTTNTVGPVSITVRLRVEDAHQDQAAEIRAGLTDHPKWLSPKWLYDERGCELFEEITRLEEYYPTRTERAILVERALEIAKLTEADTLVELGSGTSDKTRILLDALRDGSTLERYAPFDVAEPTLRAASLAIAQAYPGVRVEGVVGDFEHHLAEIPRGGRRLVAFLGGTIGNLAPNERRSFLANLSDTMAPGDHFLLGTDLVKDRRRLVAAYDDASGVTAAFDLNVLSVLNERFGANFDLGAFEHLARFDEEHEWIEMRLVSLTAQRVSLADLDLEIEFEAGESVRTEISAKFRRRGIEVELAAAGFTGQGWWTDPADDFALSLWSR